MDWFTRNKQLGTSRSRSSISVHGDLSRSRTTKPDHHPKRNFGGVSHRVYKYLLTVGLSCVFPSQAFANTVGGVSATANPVANSSGSVTNQAIQVLQGPYITNTYGGGIQCQGPTLNFTPYVTGSVSAAKPFEPYYYDPVYDVSDINEDGILDNPGDIIFEKRTRTGQKDNYSLGVGFSATWSRPLDRKLQDQCKEAAATQIALQQQLTANKRLDFELARLKTCGNLMKEGILFTPGTEMAKLCADVTVMNTTAIAPHRHSIPAPISRDANDLGGTISSSPSATGVSRQRKAPQP